MAQGLSAANLANKWLDMLRGVAFTGPTNVYVGLHTGDPGANGTANVSALTTRNQLTWNVASAGMLISSSLAPFTMTATETIRFASIWDATTAGNFLFSGDLQVGGSIAVVAGDTLTFAHFDFGWPFGVAA